MFPPFRTADEHELRKVVLANSCSCIVWERDKPEQDDEPRFVVREIILVIVHGTLKSFLIISRQ